MTYIGGRIIGVFAIQFLIMAWMFQSNVIAETGMRPVVPPVDESRKIVEECMRDAQRFQCTEWSSLQEQQREKAADILMAPKQNRGDIGKKIRGSNNASTTHIAVFSGNVLTIFPGQNRDAKKLNFMAVSDDQIQTFINQLIQRAKDNVLFVMNFILKIFKSTQKSQNQINNDG